MSTQLSYLQLLEDRGQAFVDQGMVQIDKVDTLETQNPLKGRGVRFYAGATPKGMPFELLARLVSSAPTALQDVLNALVKKGFVEKHSRLRRSRFASLDVARHKVEILELSVPTDEMVKRWSTSESRDHVLVEVDATQEALQALIREISSAASVEHATHQARHSALPLETAASADRRAKLAKDWLDASAVSRLVGSTAVNTSQLPNRLRREGRILGVWIVSKNQYRFPLWQFTTTGQVIPEMHALLAVLRGPRGIAGGRQTSGWEEVEWFYAPHALLEKRKPSELLISDPARVLRAAEREFGADANARW